MQKQQVKQLFYGIVVTTFALIIAAQFGRLTPEWTVIKVDNSLYMLGAGIILGLGIAAVKPLLLFLTVRITNSAYWLITFLFSALVIRLLSVWLPGFSVAGSGALLIAALLVIAANLFFSKLDI